MTLESFWVYNVLVPVNHFVTECAENVLDVPPVYEQHKFVACWVVVASLDEKFVLWVRSLVKFDFRQRVNFKSYFPEILD